MNIKRHIVGLLAGLCMAACSFLAMFTLMSSVPFYYDGLDGVLLFWRDDSDKYGDSWKWQGLLGIILGCVGGVLLWRWLMLVTGFYTQEEMNGTVARKE